METQGAIVITRYRTGLAFGAMLFAGSVCAAQSSHREKAKPTPLIDSIQGRALYKAYCASCHGAGAKGDAAMPASPKAKPSDLLRIAARNGATFPLIRIERITSGED